MSSSYLCIQLTSAFLHGRYLRRPVKSWIMGSASPGNEQQKVAIVDTMFLINTDEALEAGSFIIEWFTKEAKNSETASIPRCLHFTINSTTCLKSSLWISAPQHSICTTKVQCITSISTLIYNRNSPYVTSLFVGFSWSLFSFFFLFWLSPYRPKRKSMTFMQ